MHLGHIEYLMEGIKRSDHLVVGITNFDPFTGADDKNANLSHLSHFKREANPFTYFERMQMVKESLKEEGVPLEMFDITPFPIEFPERIENYAPLNATYLLTIYDEWGREKLKRLQELGLKTDVMWERTDAERLTSGTEIRGLIAKGNEWKHLVPPAVHRYIITNKLDERIKKNV